MYKKLLITVSIVLLSTASFADTCPTISQVKHGKLTLWKAYDSDDGKLVSAHRATEFKRIAEQFALAEWSNGKVHCYYRDKDGSDLEVYLAKDHLNVSNNKNYWYEVSGFMHCAAGMKECEFQAMPQTKAPQLAKKAATKLPVTSEKM